MAKDRKPLAIGNTIAALWRSLVIDLFDAYRPERHYMRGPGPKWREKHGQDGAAAGLVQHPMQLGDKWDF